MPPKEKKVNPQHSESGQSLVEFAVSLVILLVLLAGVVDIGRMAFYYLALRDAAQEGVSYGAIFPNNNHEIITRALAGAIDETRVEVDLKIKGTSATYACKSTQPCAAYQDTCALVNVSVGNIVEITVTDPSFPISMPFLGSILGRQTVNLSSTMQNAVIRVPSCN